MAASRPGPSPPSPSPRRHHRRRRRLLRCARRPSRVRRRPARCSPLRRRGRSARHHRRRRRPARSRCAEQTHRPRPDRRNPDAPSGRFDSRAFSCDERTARLRPSRSSVGGRWARVSGWRRGWRRVTAAQPSRVSVRSTIIGASAASDVVVAVGEDAADHQPTIGGGQAPEIVGELDQRRSEDVGNDEMEVPVELDRPASCRPRRDRPPRCVRRCPGSPRPQPMPRRRPERGWRRPRAAITAITPVPQPTSSTRATHTEVRGAPPAATAASSGGHRDRTLPRARSRSHDTVVDCVLLPCGHDDQSIVDPHRLGELAPGVGGTVDDVDDPARPPLPQRRDRTCDRLGLVTDRCPQLDAWSIGSSQRSSIARTPSCHSTSDATSTSSGGTVDHERTHGDQSSRRSDVRYCSIRST